MLRLLGVVLAVFLTLIGLFPLATPVAAQATIAGIVGVVTDSSGAVLPGVAVVATGPALQVPQVEAVTNERGEYRLSPLPIGLYTVRYELSGFQTVRRENVRISVGFVATLDQVMSLGTVEETITVSGQSPLVDITNTATSVDISSDALEILPTTRDGLKAFMREVPGMRTNLDVGASSMTDTIVIRAYGQQGAPWQMLEGILFASSGGNGVQGAHVDFNAIESTRLQTVGSGAEMPRRGPFIDSVTKSGSNQFHGELVAYGSSDRLEGTNVNDELRAQGVRGVPRLHGMWDFSGAVGGRIIRDKLWFFVSGRAEGYNRELLNAFYADGTPILIETDQAFHAEKLQWQVSPQNKVTLFYHGALDLQIRGADQFRPYESMEIHRGPVSMYKGEWQTVRGNSMVASLQYGNWYKHAFYYALPGYRGEGHKVATVDTVTQYVTGDHLSDERTEDYFRNHFKGSVSFFGAHFLTGTHQIKTGFDYLFAGYPHKNRARQGGNYQLRFQNSAPFQIDTFNYPVRPMNDNDYVGVYVQDSWALTHRLNVSMGVRYAYDNAYAPPQCQAATEFDRGGCWDKIQMRIWHSVVPRIHAAYDLFGDSKSVIKGGFGRFVNLREVNPEVVAANRNNRTTSRWTWRDLNNNRLYDPGEVNLDPNGPDFRDIIGVTDAVPNPDEPLPTSDEWSLTFERELASNWAIRTTGVYATNFDLRRTEEVKRPYSVYNIPITGRDPGPDGSLGNADDGGLVTYWDYPAALSGRQNAGTTLVSWPGSQTYKTIEVAGTRRMSGKWQVNLSFSATKFNVPFTDRQALNPNSEINTSANYWEYTAKASGGYILPYTIVGSANYERRLGDPQARTHQFTGGQTIPSIVLSVEPQGSIRLPDTDLVDFRFAKRMRIRGSQTLEARFDFFNVFNANFVRARNLRSGRDYLLPTQIILPRILQMGVTYNF
jgi:carboxypeptidase family protein/TonB-dependent receptor-like protein